MPETLDLATGCYYQNITTRKKIEVIAVEAGAFGATMVKVYYLISGMTCWYNKLDFNRMFRSIPPVTTKELLADIEVQKYKK